MASTKVNGPALKAIRERTELSVPEVVRLLREQGVELHEKSLWNIEGGRRNASPKVIGALARVLGIPKAAIVGGPE